MRADAHHRSGRIPRDIRTRRGFASLIPERIRQEPLSRHSTLARKLVAPELAAVYEYLTTCPDPDPRSRGAAKQCAPVLSKGRQGLGTTNLRRPTSFAAQYRGRAREVTRCAASPVGRVTR